MEKCRGSPYAVTLQCDCTSLRVYAGSRQRWRSFPRLVSSCMCAMFVFLHNRLRFGFNGKVVWDVMTEQRIDSLRAVAVFPCIRVLLLQLNMGATWQLWAISHQVFATVESIFHLWCISVGLYCKTFQQIIEKYKLYFNYVFWATLSSSECWEYSLTELERKIQFLALLDEGNAITQKLTDF